MGQPDAQRNQTLAAAMKGSDASCDVVTRSFFQWFDESNRDAYWSVACGNGSAFAIQILNDPPGAVRAVDCVAVSAAAQTSPVTECFKPWDEPDANPAAVPTDGEPPAWTSGGTSRDATGRKWNKAKAENRLATAAMLVVAMKGDDAARDFKSWDQVLVAAYALQRCIDEAVRPPSVMLKSKVSQVAAMCFVVMQDE